MAKNGRRTFNAFIKDELLRNVVNNKPDINDEEFYSRVQKKAYELFEKRGYQHGHDMEDWLTAERLVRKELSR